MAMLPHGNWRVTGNMHANHGPGPEQYVLLNQWFKQYLAGEEQNIPATPPSRMEIKNGTAHFTVTPAQQERLKDVEIYYSYHPNPVTRFWNKANATHEGQTWSATIPVHAKLPLFAFALCRYELPEEQPLQSSSTKTFTLNSLEHTHIPSDIDLAAFKALPKTTLIDDFSHGMTNWGSGDKRSFTTYKFQDPTLDTAQDKKLAITLNLNEENPLLLGLNIDSKFNGAGNDLGSFHHGRKVTGKGPQTILLTPADFKNKDNKTLEWSKVSTFAITLTDDKTKQAIDFTTPNGSEALKRIELVNP
jgi:hypothetical protein